VELQRGHGGVGLDQYRQRVDHLKRAAAMVQTGFRQCRCGVPR
jgi:hypothetical protein